VAMDQSVGHIVEELKRLNFYDNTIIIFMSDVNLNGVMALHNIQILEWWKIK